MEFAELLSDKEVKRVHEASLEILEGVGLKVRNEKARTIFHSHGCRVDNENLSVKIPAGKVEEYRKAFVPTFTFYGRNPDFDRTIPNDRPLIVTGSSAPDIIDPETGKQRRATSLDIANIAFLINELPGYDVFSISTLADDAPEGQFSLSRFYPALKNCLKPVRSNTPNMKDLFQVIELGEIIAGGKDAYLNHPIINHHYCPVISPLTLDIDSTEAIIYLVEKGLPVYGTVVPNGGVSAPFTLPGTLVLGNAEFLALSVLMQMIRPQTPLIYSVLSTVADIRTGAYSPGGIETGMLQIAHTQMAHFYGVPSGGYIGLTNSHVNDAQSGYETGMNSVAALLGGADIFNMGGLLSSLMAFDYAKAVIDNEMAQMLKRMGRGMEFSEEALGMDTIFRVGPGGNFIESEHTFQYMKKTVFFPQVATREMKSIWLENGKKDAQTRAMEIVNRILCKENPAIFSDNVEQKIRSHFKGMVAGNTGWETD